MYGIPVLYPPRKIVAGGGSYFGGGGRGLYRTKFRKIYAKEIPWQHIFPEEEEPETIEPPEPRAVRSVDDFVPAINESAARLNDLQELARALVQVGDGALLIKADMEALSRAIRLEYARLALLLEDEIICLIALG